MLKEIDGRLIYDCGKCKENVFTATSLEHVADLPHTFTCAGCGTRYTAQLNENGKLRVYRGEGRKLKQEPGTETETELGTEPATETDEDQTGEETAGDQVREEAGEQEDTGEGIVPSGGEAERSAEEEDTGVPSVSEGEGLAEGGEEESGG